MVILLTIVAKETIILLECIVQNLQMLNEKKMAQKKLNGGNEIMEVLIVVGFVAFIVWVIKEWAFYTRMDGQIKRIVEDNSRTIMDDIHKRK